MRWEREAGEEILTERPLVRPLGLEKALNTRQDSDQAVLAVCISSSISFDPVAGKEAVY